jgi:hypothetical protein
MQTGLGNNRQSRAAGDSSMLTALKRNQAIAQNQLTTKANKNTIYSYIFPVVIGREQTSTTNLAVQLLGPQFPKPTN